MNNSLHLSHIEKEDMQHLYKWFSDSEFLKYYDYYPPVPQTEEEVDKTFEDYEKKEESRVFAIRLLNNNLVGIAGFDDIIKENKVATLFIGIGSKEFRGKGLGREAIRLLLKYGFEDMGLYRIQLNVLEFNDSAIRLYEGAGFKKEGTLRKFVLRENERFDLYMYGLLKDEWENNS